MPGVLFHNVRLSWFRHVLIFWLAVLGCSVSRSATAACVASADNLTLNCSGTLGIGSGVPITIYDAAAAYQPTNGSNSYTPNNPAFPAASYPNTPGYNPNPPTTTVNFDSTVSINAVNPSSAALADKALIVSNYSNSESINGNGVNNVVLNNAGSIALTTNQYTSRMDTIVSDSQVASFTVNNTGTISATQNAFSAFSAANLGLKSSGSPATYTATYNGSSNSLADIAALYSDDNTNEFTLNNGSTGNVLAIGNFATTYYGRADTTITNNGTIANTSWLSSDTIANGHWAIAAWAGTDYVTAANTNPDSTIVLLNSSGAATVQGTSALTLTNNAGGVIKGDILALDITPLVYAAAVGSSTNPFANPAQSVLNLTVSDSNGGPRDSNIANYGSITGNFYLGSGTHVFDNAAGGTIAGNINVDQRPFQVSFSTPNLGSAAGTYLSQGGTDFNGNACPAAGQNTSDPGCAGTHSVLGTVVGGQSLTFTNEGTFTGDIRILDQPSSVNSITLTGTGFSGNIVALNGTGSNSLTLNGVTNLASINKFSNLNLTTSQVVVTPNATTGSLPGTTQGVTLVPNATIATTIFGPGGTLSAPSTNLGSLTFVGGTTANQLILQGGTTIVPTLLSGVKNGGVYELASNFNAIGGPSSVSVSLNSALVSFAFSDGPPLLQANVRDAFSIAGFSKPGAQTVNALDSYSGNNQAVQQLAGLLQSLPTDAAVRAAGEQLRPESNGASIQPLLQLTRQIYAGVDWRLDQDASAAAGYNGAPALYDYVSNEGAPLTNENFWALAFGSQLNQGGMSNVDGYKAAVNGVVAGYDTWIAPKLRIGGALTYGVTTADSNGATSGDSTHIDSYLGLVYGSWRDRGWYLNAAAGYGYHEYLTNRTITLVSDTASGAHSGNQYMGRIDGGIPLQTAYVTMVPLAEFSYAHLYQSGFSETAALGAGLSYASRSTDSAVSGVGLKAVVPFKFAGLPFTCEGRAVWDHEFGNTASSNLVTFAGGSFFPTEGLQLARNFADLGAAVKLAPTGSIDVAVSYDAYAGSQYLAQTAMARVNVKF